MPRLMTQFERARNLISQPPEKRMEHEILQLVPWLRSKAKLFKQLKSELLADIMRNCMIETKEHDDIIIKQGDTGECFYIVLSGKVSIYILNKDELEGMEDDGVFDNIIHYNDKGKLDRERLGYMVTHLGTGAPFGEVALMSDSVRTASIIAEERTDLLVVDRKLYNRSIKEVLAKEFQEKTNFISNNPLFSNWAPKYRKQLAMAMYKESFGYESPLVRQGDRTIEMFFILSGQVEIQVDPSMHPHQYPRIFKAARENGVEKLIKKAGTQRQAKHSKSSKNRTSSTSGGGVEPHLPVPGNHQIKRRDTSRCTRLCHLGVNESVGDAELTLDLPTYMQSAVCTQTTEVLVLEHRHYVRLFTRRHPKSIDKMRNELGVKLDSRLSLLSLKQEIPFLQYVRQMIASHNQPPPATDNEQDEHTVYTAEKEFLNHKGPLIDLNGPGSVFFLINLREKTKMRLRAKRGGPTERQMIMHQSFKNGRPRSFRDMQLLTQFVSAAKQSSAIGLPEELAILTGGPSVEGPATNLGGYFSHEMALVHDQDDEERLEEEAGGSGGAASPPETENQRPVTGDGGLYLQDRETTDFLTHHHHLHQHDLHQQQLQHLPRRQHNLGQMSPARSPEQISPRPTTGWLSSLTSVQGSLQENVEVNEASLSTLEARLRHFLETGNPRDRPQVAQLRRLALEDMDVQPKPGNKVVVRRKDPLKVVTPDAPVNLMARILTRPRVAENGTAGLSRREKQLL